jgi:hypothetical protein
MIRGKFTGRFAIGSTIKGLPALGPRKTLDGIVRAGQPLAHAMILAAALAVPGNGNIEIKRRRESAGHDNGSTDG